MIISIDAESTYDNTQHPFMIKNKVGIEEAYFSIIKAIYNKHKGNIILNSERLKVFPLYSEEHKTLMDDTNRVPGHTSL